MENLLAFGTVVLSTGLGLSMSEIKESPLREKKRTL